MPRKAKLSLRPLHALLVCALAAQIGFSYKLRPLKPHLDIVPAVPSSSSVKALSLGDEQFYFRVLALVLQNSGDTFGRFTPLKDYDFSKLKQWFLLLDTLDARSHMIPALAAYYFSQSQNIEDSRYIVDYLYEHASKQPKQKWWWLIQALYLAQHKLNDMDLALKVAEPLYDPDVPAWAQQMLAVVYEKRGEMEDALNIMESIQKNAKHFTDMDLKYMRYFIEERIEALDKQHPAKKE